MRVKPNALEVWNDAVLQDLLHVGDVVQTEQRSGAAISFNSGSCVSVRPTASSTSGARPSSPPRRGVSSRGT